jgi:Ca2+-binding RTX toxin-like protein
VQSAVTLSLSNTAQVLGAVENLTLTGTSAINGTGNALNNVLTGNSAKNILQGLGGNDIYVVGAADVVDENAAGSSGIDTVQSGVTLSLANTAQVLGAVENLTLTGSSAINGTGNALNNVLTGNAGANRLTGGNGHDTLTGGLGADAFDFNAIVESLATVTDRDVIVDFQQGIDKIDLSTIDAGSVAGDQAFQFLGLGALTGAEGQLNYALVDVTGTANDRTIVTGDINGSAAGGQFQIELVGLIKLTSGDFIL